MLSTIWFWWCTVRESHLWRRRWKRDCNPEERRRTRSCSDTHLNAQTSYINKTASWCHAATSNFALRDVAHYPYVISFSHLSALLPSEILLPGQGRPEVRQEHRWCKYIRSTRSSQTHRGDFGPCNVCVVRLTVSSRQINLYFKALTPSQSHYQG